MSLRNGLLRMWMVGTSLWLAWQAWGVWQDWRWRTVVAPLEPGTFTLSPDEIRGLHVDHLSETLVIFGTPLLILLIGVLIDWTIRGFRASREKA